MRILRSSRKSKKVSVVMADRIARVAIAVLPEKEFRTEEFLKKYDLVPTNYSSKNSN